MSRNKKIFSAKPAILLAAAAGLLLFATVGSTRAALTYYSENYAAEVTVSNIGVTLTENGTAVGYRDYTHKNGRWNESEGTLLSGLLADGEKFVPGKEYPERLAVTNSGTIDTYIRVIVKKSWIDQEGKDTTLSPELIDLNYTLSLHDALPILEYGPLLYKKHSIGREYAGFYGYAAHRSFHSRKSDRNRYGRKRVSDHYDGVCIRRLSISAGGGSGCRSDT